MVYCLLKYCLLSENTTGLNSNKAMRFGIAIKAFRVSANNQINFRSAIAPSGMAIIQAQRKKKTDFIPNKY